MLTEDMSKANMFKLQVDEMLARVRPNYAEIMGFVDKALRRLKALIESIEDREPVTVRNFTISSIILQADPIN